MLDSETAIEETPPTKAISSSVYPLLSQSFCFFRLYASLIFFVSSACSLDSCFKSFKFLDLSSKDISLYLSFLVKIDVALSPKTVSQSIPKFPLSDNPNSFSRVCFSYLYFRPLPLNKRLPSKDLSL